MKPTAPSNINSRFSAKFVGLLAALFGLCTLNAHAVGSGTLDQTSGWYPIGTNLTVHATPAVNSVFTSWQGNTNGATLAGAQITLSVNSSLSVTGLFSTAQFTLTVASGQGTPNPVGVTTNNPYGSLINAYVASPVVNGTTQYVATGWSGTGSVGSGTGTNVGFTITNATTLTWLWRTNVWVNLNVIGN